MPDGTVVGYYTLSATGLRLLELPADVARRLPRYPLVPAILLGRLAVDHRCRGRGFGRHLLADALLRAARSEIASYLVVVEAKDGAARSFYAHEGFLALPDQPTKRFRAMSEIKKLL
jgi:GNAT superfamily N-acetyltransferase